MGLLVNQGTYNDLTASFLDGPNGWEPQRENNGKLYITLPFSISRSNGNNAIGAGLIASGGAGNASLDRILSFSVMAFPIPANANQEVPLRFLNEERKFAGTPTFQSMSVTFNDYLDADTVGVMTAWRHRVYNPYNGKVGWKRSYAGTGHIDMFGPNGQQVRTHLLVGVWPSEFNPGQVNMQGDATVQCGITLAVDKVYYNYAVTAASNFDTDGGSSGNVNLQAVQQGLF